MQLIRLTSNRIVNIDAVLYAYWDEDCFWLDMGSSSVCLCENDAHECWQYLKARSRLMPSTGDIKSVEVSGLNLEV